MISGKKFRLLSITKFHIGYYTKNFYRGLKISSLKSIYWNNFKTIFELTAKYYIRQELNCKDFDIFEI